VAKDVCNVLEIIWTKDATDGLDDDEKGGASIPTPGGKQSMTVISESGLYSLILRSRKPEARKPKGCRQYLHPWRERLGSIGHVPEEWKGRKRIPTPGIEHRCSTGGKAPQE
jgi:hypothetical protein